MKLWEMAKKRNEDNLALFSNKMANDEMLTEFEMYYLSNHKYIDSMYVIKYGERDFFTRLSDDMESDILNEYRDILQGHLLANADSYKRIWSALTAEYNPIENYDRLEDGKVMTTGDTSIKSGTDTVANTGDTSIKSGTDTVANTGDTSIKSGTDTVTNTGDTSIKSGTDSDKNTKTGVEMFAKVGSENTADTVGAVSNTTTDSKAPIDSTDYLANNRSQSDTTQQSNSHSLSFNERSDNHSFLDWNDTTTHTFNSKDSVNTTATNTYNSKDSIDTTTTNTYNSKDSIDTTTTNTYNSKDSINTTSSTTTHIHGNIGVTTAQQMISEELRLRATNFFDTIFKPIVLDYFY